MDAVMPPALAGGITRGPRGGAGSALEADRDPAVAVGGTDHEHRAGRRWWRRGGWVAVGSGAVGAGAVRAHQAITLRASITEPAFTASAPASLVFCAKRGITLPAVPPPRIIAISGTPVRPLDGDPVV